MELPHPFGLHFFSSLEESISNVFNSPIILNDQYCRKEDSTRCSKGETALFPLHPLNSLNNGFSDKVLTCNH